MIRRHLTAPAWQRLRDSSGRRHERVQTSRGGLTGSDASGWALLATRHEGRGRGLDEGERRGRLLELSDHRRERGEHRRGRATRCAQVALVGPAVVVTMHPDGGVVHVLVRILSRIRDLMRMPVHGNLANMLSDAFLRARHGRRDSSLDRDQHGKDEQQPDAKDLHGTKYQQEPIAIVNIATVARSSLITCSTSDRPCVDGLLKRTGHLARRLRASR